jgi:hypothetical protein
MYPNIAEIDTDLNGFGRDHVRRMMEEESLVYPIEDAVEEWLDIEWWLKQNEFAFSMTGGNCTAWTTKIGKQLIMITDLSGLDTPLFKDKYCTVGVYDKNGNMLDCCDYELQDLMEDW